MGSERANLTATAVALLSCAAVACSEPPTSIDAGRDVDIDASGAPDSSDADVVDATDAQWDGDVRPYDVPPDGSLSDASRDVDVGSDAEARDVGPDIPPCVPSPDRPQPFVEAPQLLSETGLYADTQARTLADDVREFEPKHELWSDGAVKTRWVWLPECATIDTSDPDHWSLPVGAKFWKQFVVDGTLVETRLIHRYGPGDDDFLFGAYIWNDDETDAVLTPGGEADARGTTHDVPNSQACEACHGRLPDRILAFSAIQLDHDGPGVVLDDLEAERRLTDPIPATREIPGGPQDQEALGYMHANCGNCHNDSPLALQLPNTPLSLRVSVHDTDVSQVGVSRTAVDVPVDRFSHPTCSLRIDPGSPSTSCLLLRMQLRGRIEQMPPIGTEIPHPAGIDTISNWIESLP